MLVSSSPWLGALLLVAAGFYQWTPAKEACLRHCRMPAHFIAEHWRPGVAGALRMGAIHGLFCLGCCWALMRHPAPRSSAIRPAARRSGARPRVSGAPATRQSDRCLLRGARPVRPGARRRSREAV
ncbi:MAG: DUF2182 domain-containing protein [Deltaproteobacteria bacterium]|nr:DUF2182 domain-containing protein [Deltaproteobacteria bacterium]MBW2421427.1 DUF2182 domain-containing protein [Deltaproteobacteria bacterium]